MSRRYKVREQSEAPKKLRICPFGSFCYQDTGLRYVNLIIRVQCYPMHAFVYRTAKRVRIPFLTGDRDKWQVWASFDTQLQNEKEFRFELVRRSWKKNW